MATKSKKQEQEQEQNAQDGIDIIYQLNGDNLRRVVVFGRLLLYCESLGLEPDDIPAFDKIDYPSVIGILDRLLPQTHR
jgi:hypothetical protein